MSDDVRRPLILIIENDSSLADALALLVSDWGFASFSARSGSAAARTLGSHIEDVRAIVVDFHLDDGFTGIKEAVAITKAIGHPVPTIVTTAHAMLAEHEDVFPVLSKPFDPGVLRRWLEHHVGSA